LDEVLAALECLGKRPRQQGEFALPDLGTILVEVRRVRAAKMGFSNPEMANVSFVGGK